MSDVAIRLTILGLTVLLSLLSHAADHTSVANLKKALERGPCAPMPFAMSGHVLNLNTSRADTLHDALSHKGTFTFEDGTGRITLMCQTAAVPQPGCLIAVTGTAWVAKSLDTFIYAKSATVIGQKPLPPPIDIPLQNLSENKHDLLLIRSRGTVIDFFQDEIDPGTDFLLVKDGDTILPIALSHGAVSSDMNDARVEFVGRYNKSVSGMRKFSGPFVNLEQNDGITVIKPAPPDRFLVPDLEYVNSIAPREIAALGKRRLSGTVLAAWQQNRLAMRSSDGRIVMVTLAHGVPLPAVHANVTVAGLPQTDLFRINLTRAIWRPDETPRASPEEITDLPDESLSRTTADRPLILDQFCGKTVRLRGLVKNVSLPHIGQGQLTLARDGLLISIDPGTVDMAFADIPVGSEIEVTGVCIVLTETWQPHLVFPHATGSLLVLRTRQDIRILSHPPWWTPGKLLAVIAGLLLALGAFVVWNCVLNRLAARRGRELFESQIAETVSALKVEERTRLAAELHDALSQNLSAVACQVAAAKSTVTNESETQALLTTAERMLQSSRTELTRCLWDLRGDALEETDFTRAIENTLRRLSLKTDLHVRFNVLRTRVDDTAAHAILCIVRELVTNAVKHGEATEVRVAGETHEDVISFSVRDNGSGFDTEHAAGTDMGHFGLEGIRDRANRLNGTFEITSSVGHGTKAVVTLPLGHESTATEFTA